MSWYYLVAGVLAGFLAIAELFNAGRKAPCLRACPLLIVLFLFDAGSAMLAHAVLLEALKGLTWFTGIWPAILAGLCGPALLRSQLSLLGSGQESAFYGPANRYRRIQAYIESTIDDISASVQANWIASKALPAIQTLTLEELQIQSENYLKTVTRLGDEERLQVLDQLGKIFLDTVDEDEKKKWVVQLLIDNGGRRHVRALMQRGKAKKKGR